jgi:uncharacterized delta-60 repeat protein
VHLQPDGKLLVLAGGLMRYLPDGTLDSTFHFNGAGVISDSISGPRGIGLADFALQADGSIVGLGYYGVGVHGTAQALVQLRPDGSFYRVLHDLSGEGDGSNSYPSAALAINPHGRIVVADANYGQIDVYQFFSTGSLDPSFGTDGLLTIEPGGAPAVNAMAVAPDGSIILAGSRSVDPTDQYASPTGNFLLARITAHGVLESTFGANGLVLTSFGDPFNAKINAMALLADGSIVVAGTNDDGQIKGRGFALAKYTAAGALISAFGTGGKVSTDFGQFDFATSLVVQPDGKLVVAGTTGEDDYFYDDTPRNSLLVRYNADGTLDHTFGNAGVVRTVFRAGAGESLGGAVVLTNGKIVAVGNTVLPTDDPYEPISDITLARYLGSATAPSATIAGTIFNDTNANGVRDAGEAGLAGWGVYLDLNANGMFDGDEPRVFTVANGNYAFTHLPAGDYRIGEIRPAGWRRISPAGEFTVRVNAGEHVTGKNFADCRP